MHDAVCIDQDKVQIHKKFGKTNAPGEARTLNLRIAKPVLLISTTR